MSQSCELVIHFWMNEASWDLFRTFEAVARLGSLTAAAQALGVSQSTVSRHLAQLEQDAGSPLLLRGSPARPTERGEALLAAIQPMIGAAMAARSALEDRPELHGEVTLSTVGEVVRWVLARRLSLFYRAYPRLRLRLLASNQLSSLAAGEADLAIRLARPQRGDLVARRVWTETFGFFAAEGVRLHEEIPWLGLAGSLAQIPEQKHAARVFSSRPPRLVVEDVETLGIAVQEGVGVAILPRRFASSLQGLVEVTPEAVGAKTHEPVAPRDFWLVVHRSKQRLPKVRAVISWLQGVFPVG